MSYPDVHRDFVALNVGCGMMWNGRGGGIESFVLC